MERTKILIVDDEQDVVQALQFRLETAGYETFTASNGAEALQLLSERKVDLILSDFMMPEVNGLELTRRVKENPNWARIKVVLFSCNAEPEFQRRAIELGAVDYLPKMTGAGSIVVRVYELLAPEQKQPGESGAAIPDESPEQRALAQQMRTISEGIVDFIHLVRMSDELSTSADYALQSAESLAEDLHRLASSLDASSRPMMKAGSQAVVAGALRHPVGPAGGLVESRGAEVGDEGSERVPCLDGESRGESGAGESATGESAGGESATEYSEPQT
jgi:CheY-like chemotaxis protein